MSPLVFFKSLADETRLTCLLLILAEQELCVCELMAALDEGQPKISRHLALLKQNGLLTDRKLKQWVFYRLNPNLPSWIGSSLELTLKENLAAISDHLARLHAMGDRPSRQAQCC